MSITATDRELLEYFVQLDEQQKISLLQLIKSFSKNETQGNKAPTLAEYNLEIEEAMDRVKNGRFTTLEELEKEMEAW